MTQVSLLPSAETSSLERLSAVALARFGEGSPTTADGDAYLMLIGFANEVIDDMLAHPYWRSGDAVPPYFVHPSDSRLIPDTLLLKGLVSRIAMQQGSKKAGVYESQYLQALNQQMMLRRFGPGANYEISAPDMPAPNPVV
ncbi:hypothetical protein UFOVP708_65 [uncultured Caudovirales phage]|uniref:Uncharacterized protein n=1 Tax=uncultured Caudovirales phage TaxID=2100421 RepID=A0A6J5NQC8_9CAUD|nr:hypothetical protein UFOVP708_65 [uncultured Caudovirales phage]